MSHSPERISSYRRHFEGSSCVRVSSPSPTRRPRSASYTRGTATNSLCAVRTISSTRAPLKTGVSVTTLCLSAGLGAGMDLDAATAENQKFLSTRSSERQEMVVLNDRLAAYIEKVRNLEQQNKLLETEIEELQKRYMKPSGLRGMYEEQLRELKRTANQTTAQREMALAAKVAMAGRLEMLKAKYEEVAETRKKVELDIETFRPDVDASTSARIALEKQLENLEIEIQFLQRVQKEEIEELMQKICSNVAKVEMAFALPDLASALKLIQSQYDDISAKNLQEMDAWYKAKFEDLNHASSKHVEQFRSLREEIAGLKRDILNKGRELEALKNRNAVLEAQIHEVQETHKNQQEELQEKIDTLKLELKSTKEKITLHIREYQELLNIKMALEIEIVTYRKLIEGEDSRLASMGSMVLMVTGTGPGRIGHTQIGAIQSYSEEQAMETTERKTFLIRTVRAEDNTVQSNKLERTITISGAASDSDQD